MSKVNMPSEGFVPLPVSLVEALARTQFAGHERRVFDFLCRKTIGWNKPSDIISLSQFMNGTELTKSEVCHAIEKLLRRHIIRKDVAKIHNVSLVRYHINTCFGSWQSLEKSTTLQKSPILALEKSTHTISTLKETIPPSLGSRPKVENPKPQIQTEEQTWAGISSGSYDPHKDRFHQATFNPDNDKDEER